MTGWKTWASAGIIAASAGLQAVGEEQWAQTLMILGGAFGLVGLGHKIEKASAPKR